MNTPRLDIHLIAIGGTGMAPLACLLQEKGHHVRGSDGPLYPPMSTLLERAGIAPRVGYDPAHLSPRPDLVVVGNAVRRDNPEVLEAERLGIPRLSMPEALARFFLAERKPLVVSGTHGKTTTTALAAWVYSRCGQDPGYLVGGVPRGLPGSFHDGSGPRFVIEGDEYNAAFFDRGAKFLHYQPDTLIVTSVEYDHADLYSSAEVLRDTYSKLIALLPTTGFLIACGDEDHLSRLAAAAPCPTIRYGLSAANDLHPLGPIVASPAGSRFRVRDVEAGEIELSIRLAGAHNVSNALAVWAAARHDGLSVEQVAEALATFGGVARRLEEIATHRGITVVDDFAHHPTAVAKTIAALRDRYPHRRLVILFEPRSLTAGRSFFHDLYLEAFAGTDRVLFAPTFHAGRLTNEERLDFGDLAKELVANGVAATLTESIDQLFEFAVAEARDGDVLCTMSSGAFGGLPRRLAAALAASS